MCIHCKQQYSRCVFCDSLYACAADCPDAPWNQDKPRTTPFAYLLRLRRWVGYPVDRRVIFFVGIGRH
jgi:hypothetical protein